LDFSGHLLPWRQVGTVAVNIPAYIIHNYRCPQRRQKKGMRPPKPSSRPRNNRDPTR
jgi:hypothetical protein